MITGEMFLGLYDAQAKAILAHENRNTAIRDAQALIRSLEQMDHSDYSSADALKAVQMTYTNLLFKKLSPLEIDKTILELPTGEGRTRLVNSAGHVLKEDEAYEPTQVTTLAELKELLRQKR